MARLLHGGPPIDNVRGLTASTLRGARPRPEGWGAENGLSSRSKYWADFVQHVNTLGRGLRQDYTEPMSANITVVNTSRAEPEEHLTTMTQEISSDYGSVERFLGGWLSAILAEHGALAMTRDTEEWSNSVIFCAYDDDLNLVASLTFTGVPRHVCL